MCGMATNAKRERERADRHVDPEHPAPAPEVGDETTEHRTDEDRDGERRPDDAEIARPLTRCGDRREDRLRHELQAGRAHALQHAGHDELGMSPAKPQASDAITNVTSETRNTSRGPSRSPRRADDGQQHGAGERVADDHPAHVLERAEFTGDGGEGGGDDRVVERTEERDREQRGDEDAQARGRQRRSCEDPNDRVIDATMCAPAALLLPGTDPRGPRRRSPFYPAFVEKQHKLSA